MASRRTPAGPRPLMPGEPIRAWAEASQAFREWQLTARRRVPWADEAKARYLALEANRRSMTVAELVQSFLDL
jgi:hypothetical protein